MANISSDTFFSGWHPILNSGPLHSTSITQLYMYIVHTENKYTYWEASPYIYIWASSKAEATL